MVLTPSNALPGAPVPQHLSGKTTTVQNYVYPGAVQPNSTTPTVLTTSEALPAGAFPQHGSGQTTTVRSYIFPGAVQPVVSSSTSHTQTLTESVTNTDTKVSVSTRPLIETITNSDIFVHLSSLYRTLVEAITNTDTAFEGKMVSSGPNSPATGADDATVGSITWVNPGNIFSSDGSYATATMTATPSHYLKATNFGFSIPTGATILGIKVEIEKLEAGSVFDNEVKIVKSDGSIGTTDKSNITEWPTTEAYTTYGGSSDLWGETWTATDINSANFGAVISAKT